MAGTLVAGAFLSGAANVLLDRLASRDFVSFFSKRKLDHGLINKLEGTLLVLQAVLDDAEEKQITNKNVKLWLDKLQHVLYQADDLLDEIATKALRDKLEADHAQSSPPQVGFSRFFSPINPSLFRTNQSVLTSVYLSDAEMESRMKEIISMLECFVEQKNSLNLRHYVGRKPSQRQPITTPLIDEEEVCGRKDEKEKIIELLFSDSATVNEIPVIPIVGLGGIGKTTLAQSVYNDARVSDNFSIKSWVCVSDAFNVFMITKKILDDVTSSSNNDIDNLAKLQTKLKESMAGKKFLVILDDVWNDDYINWDTLRRPFRSGALESRIIVTTRNDSVASMMNPISSHLLQPLPEQDCLSLFAKHAFVNGDSMAYPELERIGKEIVNKCKGLPLAVKSLGGLMRSKLKFEEWEKISKNKIWDLDCSISPALRISYYYLPPHLKQCFAYCSVFPKDYEFELEKVVQLWIALDFVQQPKSDNSLEDEGNNYFHELLSRSFFQRSGHDKDLHFVMHDLVHDLAQDISKGFCFRLDDDQPLVHISEKVRHFSYVCGRYDGFEKFKVVKEVECLRTFMSYSKDNRYCYLGNKVLNDILPVQRSLRVLSLSYYHISELPESIENLIHLRYLDVSRTTIKQLPDSVTTLCNLLILDLSNCRSLTKLPVDMGKLINLRHLYIQGTPLTEMPAQMSKLKDLRHLSCFAVGKKDKGSSISELKELCHLSGELHISVLENVVSGQVASEAKMRDKKHLEGLVLEWNGDADDSTVERDVLDKLQPQARVKSVSILNYGSPEFPHWIRCMSKDSFPKMESLELKSCGNCYFLPSIGQLPSLKHLKIEGMAGITEVGREFYEDAFSSSSSIKPFQSLETLSFNKMPEWKEWNALGAGEFSRLLKLSIVKCPKLTGELPNHFPSLRELEISECDQLMSSHIGLLLQGLASLGELKMSKISNLTELPQQLQHLSSLQKLEIYGMPNLKELPLELCRLIKLERMKIGGCPSLVSFPDMGLPPMLKALDIWNCEALKCLTVASSSAAEGLNNMTGINNICLEELHISYCSSLLEVSFPNMYSGLPPPTLKLLHIGECRSLKFPMPEETDHNYHTSIEDLRIRNSCDLLKSMSLGFFPKLRDLDIFGCVNLETLSFPKEELHNLVKLTIGDCPKMEMIGGGDGGGLLSAPNLMDLWIMKCKNLKWLPQRMSILLPSLQSLEIEDCPEVESLADTGGGLPSNLHYLGIYNCEKVMKGRMGWGLQQTLLPSLAHIRLSGEYSEEELESFPEEWLLPTTLTELWIQHLPNLKSINHKGLQHLTSLQTLIIWVCPKLECLPQEGLPNSLSYLGIYKCPKVKERCQREKGQDWPIISPIRHIYNIGEGEDIVNLE